MRNLRIFSALIALAFLLNGCATDSPRGSSSDAAEADDSLQPIDPTDPTNNQSGKVSCVGIAPPANIQQIQHDQCADWGITECTSTLDRCESEAGVSTCCCILCGLRQGDPTCFNVRCP